MTERAAAGRLDWRIVLTSDVPASLVVFLVALPLCMGVAIASGLPPAAGLITGIVGGLVVGCFSGSPLQVSGPAAGLVVVVYQIVQVHGVEALAVVLILAGILQMLAGFLRLAPWFRAVSPAIIMAMLAGIGVLILAGQLHVMLDATPQANGLANLLALPQTLWRVVAPEGTSVPQRAALVGLLTIAIIVVWQTFLKKVAIPGTLIAVISTSLLTFGMGWQIRHVEVPSDPLATITLIRVESLLLCLNPEVGPILWLEALAVAAIASAESLLCATAVDRLHKGSRTQYDRELVAQGIGNMICGVLGGLPMTGVIVRSSASIRAGARTRLASILHGLWLLVLVVCFPALLTSIPVACLAGILVYTGFKLIDLHAVRSLWRVSRSEVAIYLAVLITIVVENLLTGVLLGVILSGLKLLYTISRLGVEMEEDQLQRRTVLRLHGAATFIRLPRLAAMLEKVPPDHELHVQFEDLTHIDHACLDLLTTWARQHEAQGGRLVLDWNTLHATFQEGSNNSGAERRVGPRGRLAESGPERALLTLSGLGLQRFSGDRIPR